MGSCSQYNITPQIKGRGLNVLNVLLNSKVAVKSGTDVLQLFVTYTYLGTSLMSFTIKIYISPSHNFFFTKYVRG